MNPLKMMERYITLIYSQLLVQIVVDETLDNMIRDQALEDHVVSYKVKAYFVILDIISSNLMIITLK